MTNFRNNITNTIALKSSLKILIYSIYRAEQGMETNTFQKHVEMASLTQHSMTSECKQTVS